MNNLDYKLIQFKTLVEDLEDNSNFNEWTTLKSENKRIVPLLNSIVDNIESIETQNVRILNTFNEYVGNFDVRPEYKEKLKNIDENLILALDKIYTLMVGKKPTITSIDDMEKSLVETVLDVKKLVDEQNVIIKQLNQSINLTLEEVNPYKIKDNRIMLEHKTQANSKEVNLYINGIKYDSGKYMVYKNKEGPDYINWLYNEENGGFDIDSKDYIFIEYPTIKLGEEE